MQHVWHLFNTLLLVIPAGLFVYLGGTCLRQGYQSLLFHQELNRRGQSVIGQVTSIRKETDREGHPLLYPTFRYQIGRRTYTIEPHALGVFERMKVGQSVVLRYLPEQPRHCTWRKTAATGFAWLLAGVGCLAVAVFVSIHIWQRL